MKIGDILGGEGAGGFVASVFKKFDEDESKELERGELVQLFMDAVNAIATDDMDPEQVYLFASEAAGKALVAGCGSEDGALTKEAFASFSESAEFVRLFQDAPASTVDEKGEA
mmetsp:Transcript_64588/g.145697  ORF Transcript_64588/g.145697 Transcript_64588/m.145697 type:complete len:113 (+) Transcript_64588:648-986(+)